MRAGPGPAAAADVAVFETHRPRLLGLAYRMLGLLTEAEDVVQEAYLRWHRVSPDEIRDPGAWLTTTVTRLAIDELRRQQTRRQAYVGPWLPEPWVSEAEAETSEAEASLALADDLSVALLLLLERLGPEERAAWLLHDVFDFDYADIAEALGRNQPAVRQLVVRARRRVAGQRQRFSVTADQRRGLVQRFQQALAARDEAELLRLFAADAELHSDGGGRVPAALRPVVGAPRIVRFFLGVSRRFDPADLVVRECVINGAPGFVAWGRDGEMLGSFAFEASADAIARVYVVRNPDKLQRMMKCRPETSQ